jgi:hypothetical protein
VYSPGKIIYFDPFYFKNGNTSKPKYFIVLKVIDSSIVLASLPTSKNHLPNTVKITHGCLEVKSGCINCYIFGANKIITKCGWAFELDTFMHGTQLDHYEVEMLESVYNSANDYIEVGELLDEEYRAILSCLISSDFVKNKYIRMLKS